MPIEIRELVIKAVIDDTSQQNREEASSGETASEERKSEKLEETVQKVLEVLHENKNER